MKNTKLIKNINVHLYKTMQNKGVSFQIDDCSHNQRPTLVITPSTDKTNSYLDGMQIIFEDEIYEVSQYQAGKEENELHIYLETKSFKVALTNMLKGNKKRKPIKIWN